MHPSDPFRTENPPHRRWMQEAIREALLARDEGEVPVGAVVVADGLVVGRGHNRTEALCDPTAHAEIIALGAAGVALGSWRMPQAVLYVTVEPCTMCAGALLLARIGTLVYGVADPTMGACGSWIDVVSAARLAGRLRVISGVMEEECGALMRSFFRGVRPGGQNPGPGS